MHIWNGMNFWRTLLYNVRWFWMVPTFRREREKTHLSIQWFECLFRLDPNVWTKLKHFSTIQAEDLLKFHLAICHLIFSFRSHSLFDFLYPCVCEGVYVFNMCTSRWFGTFDSLLFNSIQFHLFCYFLYGNALQLLHQMNICIGTFFFSLSAMQFIQFWILCSLLFNDSTQTSWNINKYRNHFFLFNAEVLQVKITSRNV